MRVLEYFFKATFMFAFIFFVWFMQIHWATLDFDQKAMLFFFEFISLYGLALLFMFNFKNQKL